MLTAEEKLEIINGMEFLESDGDGECLYYVFVEDNEENREKLSKVVCDVDAFIKEHASDNEIHEVAPGQFDIQMAAWDCTDADYFDGKKFVKLGHDEVNRRIYESTNC